MNHISTKIKILLNKLCTRVNLSKILTIFFVGFTSRYFINTYFHVNVFMDYLTLISLTYYSTFSIFIVITYELFNF